VVFNGVTYDSTGPYSLNFSMTYLSSSVTLPGPGPYRWHDVPFSATGAFSVMNGKTVVVSDVLTGEGSVSAMPQFGGFAAVQYTFSNVPEPTNAGLVGVSLLAAAALRRKLSTHQASGHSVEQ
jgi:hypothetical protein